MKKVAVLGKIPEIAYEKLSQHFQVTMNDDVTPMSKNEIVEMVKGKEAILSILSDTIDQDVMEAAAPDLKIIANYGAGFNNIDVETATKKNIHVTNTPVVSTYATAELTMGLLISLARRLVEGDRLTRSGKFEGWAPLFHLGTELRGKTLGIFGMGNIGKKVVQMAKAFEMKIVYHNRTRLSEDEEQALQCTYVEKEQLLKQADVVSLHMSYHPSLHHFIGEEELASMKPQALLLNLARGPLVHEEALVSALEKGVIAGAGLDVFEFEPSVTEGLKALDNVIITPHIGNATVEARREMAEMAADNIISVLQGGKPNTPVNQVKS
ncbi:D-isomer specific 2-hydroxyacid dehydrogenase [Halalkalibacter wakoensis JCM 9140]|uniref:D-isomer specific 2-hydroxyacid dehydrogenase n=1 Tax=Halalkalibacter wakoensis JCM 9140 TaxID=1236970 RepID=W4PZG6_9BACI|nr:2-hydroxyacid dehydrogenase family protein [Halalkalibacter wakoensis]GAE24489.1 D-isomer specific 2-hydroxyacid dehydrogenase [Halalkalibacter wakoensis JCM 9140]